MSIILSTGTQLAAASTYGTLVTMTAVTNAVNAVATLGAGHAVIVGDFLEITSGWDLLNGRIVRVSAVAANDVTLEGVNTSNVNNFPATGGVGSIRRITAWTTLNQVQGVSTAGGEQQFADITTIADRMQRQIPTTRSPQEITITVFDNPSLAWYAPIQTLSDNNNAAAMRMIFPGGSRLVANGFWSLQRVPTIEPNAPLTATISFSASAEPMRYAT